MEGRSGPAGPPDTDRRRNLMEWVHLALRWLHVVAGVYWIGQTALFSWLDSRMTAEATPEEERVWMVHSGGFYRVDKLRTLPALPRILHWFKWEAAITWASGALLFVLVYYLGGALVAPDGPLGRGAAVGVSVGLLVAGWVVYDLLWLSPLRRREAAASVVSFALLLAAAWGAERLLSARAAYLQVGAMIGTIMAANVWSRILPAQRRMVAAAGRGEALDPALAGLAKQRSKHNTYLAVPVLFLMISPHFPVATYGGRWAWARLGLLVLAGFAARWVVARHDRRPAR